MARTKKLSGRKIGGTRTLKDLHRYRGKRKPKKVILLICEGKKTEPIYFNSVKSELKLHSLNIVIIPGQGAPITIVERAIKEQKKLSKGDDVWCVFDVEVLKNNTSFLRAIDKARQNKINLAISNPCFEYWYILHYAYTNKPFESPQKVISYLKRFLPKYQKNLCVYQEIKMLSEDAIKNANLLRSSSSEDWMNFPNPSTSVDLLIQRVSELGV